MEAMIGNILDLQFEVLTSKDKNEIKEAVVLTPFVIKKGVLDEELDGVLLDLSYYLDIDGRLPFISKDVPEEVKSVLDTFLTNEVNRKAKSRIKGLKIKSFLGARNDMMEFLRQDEDVDTFVKSLDLVIRDAGDNRFTETFDMAYSECERYLPADNYDLVVVTTPIYVTHIDSVYIPKNKNLDAGETLKLVSVPKENDLGDEIINKKLSKVDMQSRETVVFTDDGRYYLVDTNIYGEPVMRKFSLEEFSSTEKII